MILRFLAALASLSLPLAAEVKLPALISDHMMIQQQMPVRIWGTAAAGGKVSVELHGNRASATAGSSGAWQVFLPPLAAGGPYDMTIQGVKPIVVHDVLAGEVWVGSGQSNMEWPMANVNNADAEIAAANFPQIRLYHVKPRISETPLYDTGGEWTVCTPASVRDFSAVGYFFSRYIHQHRHVPVALIQATLGGTLAQSWTARPVLESNPLLKPVFSEWEQTRAASATPLLENQPSVLWNGMVAPLTPYTIRGVVWYQGETNAGIERPYPYGLLFRSLIEDWRRQWAEGDLPFLFVQIANLRYNDTWPATREAQTEALALRNTAMVVTHDIGDAGNIHPRNKQDVGKRLGLAAQAIAYGEKLEYSGPMFRRMTREANALRLYFDHTGTGLESRGGEKLAGFEIAGKDGEYLPAEARIDDLTVVVSSDRVADPVRVRYAWADDPKATLENRERLPASLFRAELK